jgi:hypothetical protein
MSQENVERYVRSARPGRGATRRLRRHFCKATSLRTSSCIPSIWGTSIGVSRGCESCWRTSSRRGRTTASRPRRSSIWASTCLCWHMSRAAGLAAACRSTSRSPCSALSRARGRLGKVLHVQRAGPRSRRAARVNGKEQAAQRIEQAIADEQAPASRGQGHIRAPTHRVKAAGGSGKTKVGMESLVVNTKGRVLAVLKSLEEVARELGRIGREPMQAEVSG